MVVWYTSDGKDESEQSSPFRRWTTGSGAGSSYRHHEHRNMYNKQMSEGSTQVSSSTGGGSNVSRWSLGLEHLLADPAGAEAFAHFLAKEFAAENIRFWWSCEQYSATTEPTRRGALAAEIWQRHLADKAPEPVNVDAAARRAAALLLAADPPPPDLFQQAQKQIFNVMKFDSYPRFLRSGVHAECARADLRGLPLPYAPHRDNDTDTTKLKKSASNASERRRSGGGSLLPWKLRTGRERSNSTQQNEPPVVTDVVKSSQSAPGQCALCRVVLPDGATSVVGVEPALTVARLVERLLQRRNLLCTTYDVLLKDANQGTTTTIDPSSPSTVLSGREAVVERRCVVRLEVAGRAVAVRCRAARRLRHVLRPVLAKYARAHPHRAVLRDGVVLHPDTIMQELDGARLQIVEVSETGEYRASVSDTRDRDDDADSLSDLAVRLQDDTRQQDEQSVGSASSSRGSTGGAGCTGGRVRAALRPGPPLHHHPPDFLENLRETQRQRLQNKGESPPASPPPAARTPPPLPPKPSHRQAPTVV
uniref:RGS domain-containing protein n=2 Tax=Heliothis virescens TaxID=7102 RepID=A0A2A4JXI1_HELVI